MSEQPNAGEKAVLRWLIDGGHDATRATLCVAPADHGRPCDVLAFIDRVERDQLRSWALGFPALSNIARLRLLRATDAEVGGIVVNLLQAAWHMNAVENG